jgi:hypothetical protein
MGIISALVLLLASCSSVFTSTITGTVEEMDGTSEVSVEGVDVYAYLSQSERDSAVSAGTQPTTTVRIFHAITDANGDYSMPVEWSTTSPTFGKTADRIPVYLAFYHKDFNDRQTQRSNDGQLPFQRTHQHDGDGNPDQDE